MTPTELVLWYECLDALRLSVATPGLLSVDRSVLYGRGIDRTFAMADYCTPQRIAQVCGKCTSLERPHAGPA